MIDFSKLELLYLRRLVYVHMDDLERRKFKYQRLVSSSYYQSVSAYDERLSQVGSEIRHMQSILSKVDDLLAYIRYRLFLEFYPPPPLNYLFAYL